MNENNKPFKSSIFFSAYNTLMIHFFYKNQIILAEPQCSYFFPNFRLICSYFVLVKIIILDLALHICIFIIQAEHFWLFMTGLKEKILYFNTQICVYHILLTNGSTKYVAVEDFDGIDLILL